MTLRITEMNSEELLALVRRGELDEGEGLQVLRNPYCTTEIAEIVASSRSLLQSHVVREVLAGWRGLPFPRAMDLLATLPWTSLLNIAQSPSAPPIMKRHAEKRLLAQLLQMTLGEKVALARRVHRPLFRRLIDSADGQVLRALLDNPRLTETDVLVILNTTKPPASFFADLAKHHKWGQYGGVRRGLVECPRTPLPLALSALVQLRKSDLRKVCSRPDLPEPVRAAARALNEKDQQGLRRVIRSDEDGSCGDSTN